MWSPVYQENNWWGWKGQNGPKEGNHFIIFPVFFISNTMREGLTLFGENPLLCGGRPYVSMLFCFVVIVVVIGVFIFLLSDVLQCQLVLTRKKIILLIRFVDNYSCSRISTLFLFYHYCHPVYCTYCYFLVFIPYIWNF